MSQSGPTQPILLKFMSKNFKMMHALAILLKEFQLGMKILQTCITTKYNVYTFLLLDTYLYAVAVAGL